jgi:hypothetical protein
MQKLWCIDVTGVSKPNAEAFLQEISGMLTGSGKAVVRFNCYDMFTDPAQARMASIALGKYLTQHESRLGNYTVFREVGNRQRTGTRWKAVQVYGREGVNMGFGTVLKKMSPTDQL